MAKVRMHKGEDAKRSKAGGCTGLDNPNEPLRCVFSTVTEIRIGTGTTAKKQRSKLLWHVQQKEADEFAVHKINPQFVPVGEAKIICQAELLADYTPEVEIHNNKVEPAMSALRETIARGDNHRKQGEPLSAEMEYSRALDVDETNVRAIFGLGLVYLERGDKEKSKAVFGQLVSMSAAFDSEHKHLFNEFGIALRKSKLYEEAVSYYSRAATLSSDDENLYYNLARVFYEKDDWENCFEFVSRSLKINSYLAHSLGLCKLIVAVSKDDSLRKKYDKPVVPEGLALRFQELLGPDEDIDMTVELNPNGQSPDYEADLSTVLFDEKKD